MPLYSKDETTAALVAELAQRRGVSMQAAVKLAVLAEFERPAEATHLRDRFAALRARYPLPAATNLAADKGDDFARTDLA